MRASDRAETRGDQIVTNIEITINTDGPAFIDDDRIEVGRVLRDLAERFERTSWLPNMDCATARDSRGFQVGTVMVKP